MSFPVTCPRCNGTGTDPESHPDAPFGEDCTACQASGVIEDPMDDAKLKHDHDAPRIVKP